VLLNLVEKTKTNICFISLTSYVHVITSFNLWMFKKAHDICTLVVNLFGENWVPKHITIGLFEAFETSR
jgi:hypothetical protein